jgi:predicted NACHT family NTPase
MSAELGDALPGGWVTSRLAAGRALLLVDGVDELEPTRRKEAEAWLKQLVATYPDARYVVTTRPFAVGADWLADTGFAAFDLQPLSASGIRDFLAS